MARVLKQEEVSRKQAAISVGYGHAGVRRLRWALDGNECFDSLVVCRVMYRVMWCIVASRIARLSATISVKLRLDPDPTVFNPESICGSEVFTCV